MNITYDQLVQVINDATAVIVDYDALTFPYINEDDRYIEVSWDSPDGFIQHYIYESEVTSITYNEENNYYRIYMIEDTFYTIQPLVVAIPHYG